LFHVQLHSTEYQQSERRLASEQIHTIYDIKMFLWPFKWSFLFVCNQSSLCDGSNQHNVYEPFFRNAVYIYYSWR